MLDWHKYYLSGQMVFARRWLLTDDGDAATVLEAAHLGSYESLCLALFRGPKSDLPMAQTKKATIRVWGVAVKLACPSYRDFSIYLIMDESQVAPFFNLLDPMICAVKGIKPLRYRLLRPDMT